MNKFDLRIRNDGKGKWQSWEATSPLVDCIMNLEGYGRDRKEAIAEHLREVTEYRDELTRYLEFHNSVTEGPDSGAISQGTFKLSGKAGE